MDERTIKRLLVIIALNIIAIVLFKKMLIKTAVSVNKVVVEKTSHLRQATNRAASTNPAYSSNNRSIACYFNCR